MRALRLGVAVLLAAIGLVPAPARAADAALTGEWLRYRAGFVVDDGRVRDTGNGGVSHTESQGWAMLFAETFDDRASFDRIWNWTRSNLQRKDNALFSWRWDPGNEANPIADTNNASDGDILIAWALARAARHWRSREYRDEAKRILADIRGKLVETIGGRLVLVPGVEGFVTQDGARIVNLSYYIYPAFEEFHRIDPSPVWPRLRRDGLALLAAARFGHWGLPPDWITVDKHWRVTADTPLPPRFGFDAIRIPLYLIWGRAATAVRLAPELRFWNAFTDKPVPAWVDVKDGSVANYPAPNGIQAIVRLVRWRAQIKAPPPSPPVICEHDNYYSASLVLLAAMARRAIER